MQKKDAIKWMTEYVIRELNEGREVVIELKKNVVITPFPSCITAQFGTRELLRAIDKALNNVIDYFHEQGTKVYDCTMYCPNGIIIAYYTNPKKMERTIKELKENELFSSNVICVSNTPDIKLD